MKFSINWLNDYVDLSDIEIDELVNKLTLSGFEVESVEYAGKSLENIVVAKIEKIIKHPNADTLQICQANIGNSSLQIITRATNVFVGAYVPLALEGAVLPNGLEISKTKMRGEDSFGMFCGNSEIGLESNREDEGIYIINSTNCYPGQKLAELLNKNDYILDVTILSNRPDCNSIYFFAKEIAAILNKKCKPLDLSYGKITKDKNLNLNINVETSNCLYYSGCIVKDIKFPQTPEWMKQRLETVGIRSINAIVDITNYVLTEVGQPMHAFDYAKISGNVINVRQASNGEKLETLNEMEYSLDKDVMVIADNKKPIAMAGVMGGLYTGITNATKDIVFESASFARGCIRKTVRKFGLSSDSSARYEKGVVPALCDIGIRRALHFIQEFGIGQIACEPIIVKNSSDNDNIKVKASTASICKKLGIKLSQKEMISLLSRLDIDCKIINNDEFEAISPNYRNDIEGEHDLAEEVVRLYGFDKVEERLMTNASYTIIERNNFYESIKSIKNVLVSLGLNEIIGLPLENVNLQNKLLENISNDLVSISNPLSEEYGAIRKTSITTMLNIIKENNNHSNKNMKLYEVGKIFKKTNNYEENLVLTLAYTDKKADFFMVKSWCDMVAKTLNLEFSYVSGTKHNYLNCYKSAEIVLNNQVIGYIGEVHPQVLKNFNITEDVIVAEILLDKIVTNDNMQLQEFKPFTKFQPIVRDFTFLVPNEMEFSTLEKELVLSSGKYCTNVKLKDIYTGNNVAVGYKSLTFELIYEKMDGTFTDEEMQQNVNKLLRSLKYKLGISLKDEI